MRLPQTQLHGRNKRAIVACNVLAPSIGEIAALVVILFAYIVAGTMADRASQSVINIVGPLAMSMVLGYAIVSAIRGDRNNLWSPLLWFRISTLTYFGIGTFLIFTIDPVSRSYLEAFFWFYEEDVLKMHAVVTLSVIVTLATAKGAVHWASRKIRDSGRNVSDAVIHDAPQRLFRVGLLFLVIGLTTDLAIKVPHALGWITFEVPGAILNLTRLTMAGTFLLTVWSLQHAKWSLPLIATVVSLVVLVQLLLFSRQGVLLPLAMFLLGFVWTKASLNRMIVSATIIVSIFAILQPVISEARQELERRYGDSTEAGFVERALIIGSAFRSQPWFAASAEGSSALTRLSYVNAATLVINQYDSGHPGDWPRLLPAVFVPRLFWPDKPIITDVGRDIYELGSGRRTSQMGAGVFADAYWAMGWWGVVLFMPIYGVILGTIAVVATRIVRDGRWLFFPVALMGIQIGYRTDGHYLADVAGGTVMLASTFLALHIVQMAVRRMALPRLRQRTVLRGSVGH